MSSVLEKLQLNIEGLHCGGCAASVGAALRNLAGVSSAQVTLDAGQADVEYDPQQVTTQQMIEAVERLGYRARLVA